MLTPWRVLGLGATAAALFLALPEGGTAQAVVFLAVNAGALALVLRAVRRRQPAPALPWNLLLAGAALYFVTLVAWYVLPLAFDSTIPYPSLLDLPFLAAYLLFAGFLIRLVRVHGGPDPDALDAVIVSTGASVLLWEFFLVTAVTAGTTTLSARLVSVAYSVALLAMLALAIRIARIPVVRTAPYWLLCAWITAELVADMVYAVRSAQGSFAQGQPWFVAWIAAYTALGAAAVHPGLFDLGIRATAIRPHRPGRRLAMLGLAAAAPLAAIAYRVAEGNTDYVLGLVAIEAGLTILVLLRLSRLTVDLGQQRRVQERLESLTKQLEFQAFSDPVSGLGSRSLFNDRLELALASRRPHGRAPALLLLDLDGFKSVNDGFGHEVGDQVLAHVGRRLQVCTRSADTVARLGGDEFAIVLADSNVGEAIRVAERVRAALAEPIHIDGREFHASASAGVVVAEPGDEPSSLLRQADIAMYAAKAGNRGSFQVYNPRLHEAVLERHRLEAELGGAAARGELVLHYQPILHLVTNEIRGFEALVRWQHPERGLVPPDEFIPLAEASGTIREIGAWVLETACLQLTTWMAAGCRPINMSVNLSTRELQDPELVARVTGILGRVHIDPTLITLEVTETALMHNTDEVIDTLHRLKAIGLSLAIDDFGTGYSSLSYLRRLPIDIVKIDRSFVSGIAREHEEWALTAAIVRLANSLGKRTLAEGIELGEQLAHLRALDCEFGQGYLFSRPLPAPEIQSILKGPAPERHETSH